MQQKIKLVVQDAEEDAFQFSITLENISNAIQKKNGLTEPPNIHAVTSSSDGRHTVMFTWIEGLGYSKPLWKQASDKPSKREKVIVKLESGGKFIGEINELNYWVIYYEDGISLELIKDKVIEWTELP